MKFVSKPAAQSHHDGHNKKYSTLSQNDYEPEEDNELAPISGKSADKPNVESHQKEIDKLLQELNEYRMREKKNLGEIQLLKAQLNKKSDNTKKAQNSSENRELKEVITDDGLDSLIPSNLKVDLNDNVDNAKLADEIEKELKNISSVFK